MDQLFETGEQQSINAVLQNRDARALRQRYFIKLYPDLTLMVIKLNVPGPIKTNPQIQHIFQIGTDQIQQRYLAESASFKVIEAWQRPTGSEWFVLTDLNPMKAKQLAIAYEDETPLGRLFDIDVFSTIDQPALSRQALGQPSRRCLICMGPAKVCARSRQHSVSELQHAFSQLCKQEEIRHAAVIKH